MRGKNSIQKKRAKDAANILLIFVSEQPKSRKFEDDTNYLIASGRPYTKLVDFLEDAWNQREVILGEVHVDKEIGL